MGQKLRVLCPPFGKGGAGSPSNTMSLGSRPTFLHSGVLIHQAIWTQQIWATNWGAAPLWGRGPGSPSNTMWPGPKPTCMQSFTSIRPTVWPQYTNITDSTDNGLRANRFTTSHPKINLTIHCKNISHYVNEAHSREMYQSARYPWKIFHSPSCSGVVWKC